MMQELWKLKFHWGRKLEGCKWFRGWCIRHKADESIKSVTWKLRILGVTVSI